MWKQTWDHYTVQTECHQVKTKPAFFLSVWSLHRFTTQGPSDISVWVLDIYLLLSQIKNAFVHTLHMKFIEPVHTLWITGDSWGTTAGKIKTSCETMRFFFKKKCKTVVVSASERTDICFALLFKCLLVFGCTLVKNSCLNHTITKVSPADSSMQDIHWPSATLKHYYL